MLRHGSNHTETTKDKQNLKYILLYSNANPIRNKDSLGYGCGFCPEQYQEPLDLKKHFFKEHNDERLIKFMSDRLFEHVVKLDITTLNCAICNVHVSDLDELITHLKIQHRKKVFTDIKTPILPFKFDTPELRCAVCSTEYTTFKLLQEHMSSHFGNYICNICGHSYMSEKLLAGHLKRHKVADVKCDQCDKVFANIFRMRDHQKRTHLGQTKRNKCLICLERFTDYWKKVEHMVKEHGAPPVVLNCQACDKVFHNQRALSMHTKKDHLMERPHKCEECEMKFFNKSGLQRHMAKHTGLRLFQCDVCFKSYGRKNTLREHMRIHADDRRFVCGHCGQAFVQKCSWRSHMRSKHGEEH
ncbi:unnamed protein product [Pieris brassicae]|uniref:C2H2-type domain-containing protein n=1 Tax=Pieris brassicae TaxID=7116 RepID=A0A9P0TSB8_PIEBR|nr:unnamed protein product [Pieris brassicae]